eukprot:m.445539 g.445539  ORF g.445539 m.445539 type:complete len:85 (+) comp19240_c0_seq1:109-363(+)
MPPPVSVNKEQRAACYHARDAFYACVNQARNTGATEAGCDALRKVYEATCPVAWVSHFDKKQVYTSFKQRLKDSEYQELKLEGK